MITRKEMEDALINRFSKDIADRLAGYKKKIKSQVDAALDAEYELVILGKKPKEKKTEKVEKKFDFNSK